LKIPLPTETPVLELTRGMTLLRSYYNCLKNLCQSEKLTKPPGLIGSNAQKLTSATFLRSSGRACFALTPGEMCGTFLLSKIWNLTGKACDWVAPTTEKF
jgi:hypothetical protein